MTKAIAAAQRSPDAEPSAESAREPSNAALDAVVNSVLAPTSLSPRGGAALASTGNPEADLILQQYVGGLGYRIRVLLTLGILGSPWRQR